MSFIKRDAKDLAYAAKGCVSFRRSIKNNLSLTGAGRYYGLSKGQIRLGFGVCRPQKVLGAALECGPRFTFG